MNTKHTPGPWHVGMRPGPMIYGADSAQVADMRGGLLARDETAANVRLVVEAPAMLAALRDAHAFLDALLEMQPDAAVDALTNNGESVADMLGNAIAKAAGR